MSSSDPEEFLKQILLPYNFYYEILRPNCSHPLVNPVFY